MDFLFEKQSRFEKEPLPDIAICSECNGRFKTKNCPMEEEGTWEEGFYKVHICPTCKNGGCIDDYSYTFIQFVKYTLWLRKHK